MASSAKMFAEVVIAGSYKPLAKSARGAAGEMQGLAGKTKTTAKIMATAIAGISFAGITTQLINATKAADEDRRSMALLNQTLDNSWKANDKTKKSVDDYITSMSMMSGIADDDLRPAYGKIASVTKNMTKANKYFGLSMDIAAYSGKDLNTVSLAMAKYLGGNTKALDKLVPGVKDAGDKIGFLQDKTKGMAKIAGDNSPFAKMTVQFDEMKETIGKQLLPYVDKLATWMNSKEGQKTIKETTDALVDLIKKGIELAKWALDNKEILLSIGIALKTWQISSGVINSWKTIRDIWKTTKPPKVQLPGTTPNLPGTNPTGVVTGPGRRGVAGKKVPNVPKGTTVPRGALPATGLAAARAIPVIGTVATVLSLSGDTANSPELQARYQQEHQAYTKSVRDFKALGAYGGPISSMASNKPTGGLPLTNSLDSKSVTINVYGTTSGNDVLKALKGISQDRGIPLGQLLR